MHLILWKSNFAFYCWVCVQEARNFAVMVIITMSHDVFNRVYECNCFEINIYYFRGKDVFLKINQSLKQKAHHLGTAS